MISFDEYLKDLYSQLTCNATEEYKVKYITYTHSNKEVSDNMDFFITMYHCQISAYKALLYFSDYKDLSDEDKKESLKNWELLAIEREKEDEEIRRETETVEFCDCINEDKYKDTFKDVKEGDTLYFVSFDGKLKLEEKITNSIFGSLSSLAIKEENEDRVVPSFSIEEHKVKEKIYPGLVERHYNYMKMCGDKPCGVGTTSGFVPSDYRVDIVLDNNIKIQTGITSYSSINYSNVDYVFIHKDVLVDALKKFYEKNMELIINKRDRLNKGIKECQEQLRQI